MRGYFSIASVCYV